MRKYQKLLVWQSAMKLVTEIYRGTAKLPKHEAYGLCSQKRRAAVSIPSNIAEGSMRGSDKDFIRFLRIASGSIVELETQLIIANSVGYEIEATSLLSLCDRVFALNESLIKSMRPTSDVGPTNRKYHDN